MPSFCAVTIRQYPFVHAWLTTKVVVLVFYIGLGMLALTYGKTRRIRVGSWIAAQLCFMYIVAVALTKHPLLALMKKLACCSGLIFLFTLLACGEPNQRLDEYEFYQGPQFRLKVVRYYRNIPFNYLGEYAVVMCQSENTADFSANDRQDAGWRMLGAVAGQDNTSAREAASSVKDDYEVLDNHTLVATTSAFNISFDACGHFISWDPGRLPESMIDPVEKPDSCAPNGPVDCRHLDFEGDRAPRYEQVSITGPGQVSFTVRSKTFKGVERLRVQTGNNGAVWHVDTAGLDTDARRPVPYTVRSLSGCVTGQGHA